MFSQDKKRLRFVRYLASLLFLGIATHVAMARTPLKFDEFGKLSCGDELLRLDNYGNTVLEFPDALAVIIVYGSRTGTKRGEIAGRLFAIRDALVRRNSIDTKRIVILDGGFRETLAVELWIIPPDGRDSVKYLITSTVPAASVRLGSSTLNIRQYQCDRRSRLKQADQKTVQKK